MSASFQFSQNTFAPLMIFERIYTTEQDLRVQMLERRKDLLALANIKDILSKVDHEVERLNVANAEQFAQLLKDLKGKELSKAEEGVIVKLFLDKKRDDERR